MGILSLRGNLDRHTSIKGKPRHFATTKTHTVPRTTRRGRILCSSESERMLRKCSVTSAAQHTASIESSGYHSQSSTTTKSRPTTTENRISSTGTLNTHSNRKHDAVRSPGPRDMNMLKASATGIPKTTIAAICISILVAAALGILAVLLLRSWRCLKSRQRQSDHRPETEPRSRKFPSAGMTKVQILEKGERAAPLPERNRWSIVLPRPTREDSTPLKSETYPTRHGEPISRLRANTTLNSDERMSQCTRLTPGLGCNDVFEQRIGETAKAPPELFDVGSHSLGSLRPKQESIIEIPPVSRSFQTEPVALSFTQLPPSVGSCSSSIYTPRFERSSCEHRATGGEEELRPSTTIREIKIEAGGDVQNYLGEVYMTVVSAIGLCLTDTWLFAASPSREGCGPRHRRPIMAGVKGSTSALVQWSYAVRGAHGQSWTAWPMPRRSGLRLVETLRCSLLDISTNLFHTRHCSDFSLAQNCEPGALQHLLVSSRDPKAVYRPSLVWSSCLASRPAYSHPSSDVVTLRLITPAVVQSKMHTMRLLSVISLLPLTAFAFDPRPMDYASDNDLHVFVSRPDLRPPKFSIQVLDKKHVSSGYWFVAPYGDLLDRPPMRSYRPGQVGPLIYDGAGNLVWSGAHLFGGRTTFDFKTASCNDSTCLTFILKKDRWFPRNPRGGGVILDNTFTVKDIVPQTAGQGNMNMHEFTLTDEGTALMVSYKPVYTDVTSHWDPAHEDQEDVSAWVGDNGFQEVDLVTKKPMFEWWALDTVHPSESYVVRPDFRGVAKGAWDFFHLNSIDKNSDGDYLISARFVNSIYKISATDGSVLWQLGGRRSTFKLQGFIFSSQHDARFRHENKTHTVISFFNNAADDHIFTANVSSAMIVSLDHTTQTASLIDKWDRPDHHLTHLRGNVQLLPNGNNFVCWSENGRISEFDPTGKLLLDAHFSSHRFVTYRAFKLNLTAVPAEQPALKAYVYGAHPEESTTAIYASWNGATEAVAWRFYGTQKQGRKPAFLEEVGKTGFETTFMVTGAMCQVYAEAMAANGTVLSHSAYEQTVLPAGWEPGLCELPRSGEGKQDASTPPQAAESHHVQGPSFLQVSCEPGSFDVMRLALSCLLVAVSFLLGMSAWKIQRLKKLIRMQEGLAYVPVDKT